VVAQLLVLLETTSSFQWLSNNYLKVRKNETCASMKKIQVYEQSRQMRTKSCVPIVT